MMMNDDVSRIVFAVAASLFIKFRGFKKLLEIKCGQELTNFYY